jgi:hypothetical protein
MLLAWEAVEGVEVHTFLCMLSLPAAALKMISTEGFYSKCQNLRFLRIQHEVKAQSSYSNSIGAEVSAGGVESKMEV